MSYHEVGHALIAALQKNSEPVQKITIVPRTMGALGYVMHVPEEEKYLNSKEELHDMIVGLLGGRAAEQLVFDSVTTGASNDIEKATNIARSMVTMYGMSDKFGLVGLESIESRYLDGRTVMNCADKTAAEVDKEVMSILKDCYKEAYKMLKKNRDIMDKLAAHLIQKETITGKEFMEIFCKEKGIPVPPPKDNREQFEGKKPAEEQPKAENANNISVPQFLTEAGKEIKAEEEKKEEPAEEVFFGLSKEEMDELNSIVDAELSKEAEEAEAATKEEQVALADSEGITTEETPAEEIPAGENGNEETGEKPVADDKDEDFRNILSKRAEGKNDEVE